MSHSQCDSTDSCFFLGGYQFFGESGIVERNPCQGADPGYKLEFYPRIGLSAFRRAHEQETKEFASASDSGNDLNACALEGGLVPILNAGGWQVNERNGFN